MKVTRFIFLNTNFLKRIIDKSYILYIVESNNNISGIIIYHRIERKRNRGQAKYMERKML